MVDSRVSVLAGKRRWQAAGVLAAPVLDRHAWISLRHNAVCPAGKCAAALCGATPDLNPCCRELLDILPAHLYNGRKMHGKYNGPGEGGPSWQIMPGSSSGTIKCCT